MIQFTKNSTKKCGTYKISIGDYFYYGSSTNCDDRCLNHFIDLVKNQHGNKIMQTVFNDLNAFSSDLPPLSHLAGITIKICSGSSSIA